MSCCIFRWVRIKKHIYFVFKNQHCLGDFSSSHYFSSLAARHPTMQAISLPITLHADCESPQQHNTILSRIARSKKSYAQFIILHLTSSYSDHST